MPQTIKHKRTTTPNGEPSTLELGEVAFNIVDDPVKGWIGTPSGVKRLFEDAPSDGLLYGRRDAAWSSVPIPEVPEDTSVVPVGGQLRIVGSSPSNRIGYFPYRGGWIRIAGKDYPIPGTGVVATNNNAIIDGVAGQSVSAARYYIYMFDNAGTLALEFSSTSHEPSLVVDNIGTEIKQGDNSRTLLGATVVPASLLFTDSPRNRLTRSWLNRASSPLRADTNFISSGGGWVDSPDSITLFAWADDSVFLTVSGTCTTNLANLSYYLGIRDPIANAVLRQAFWQSPLADSQSIQSLSLSMDLAEGYRTFTAGGVATGTASIQINVMLSGIMGG